MSALAIDTTPAAKRARAHAEYAESLLADIHRMGGGAKFTQTTAAKGAMAQAHATLAIFYQGESRD